MTRKSWKQLKRDPILTTPYFKVYKDTIQLPNGKEVDDYYVIDKLDPILAVATDTGGNLITLEEYRYPVDKTMFNLPAGTIDPAIEDPKEAMARELREETGYTSDDIQFVAGLHDYPTKDSHTVHIFRVRNAKKTHATHHQQEQIEVKLMSPEDVKRLVLSGKAQTTSVVAALVVAMPELFGG